MKNRSIIFTLCLIFLPLLGHSEETSPTMKELDTSSYEQSVLAAIAYSGGAKACGDIKLSDLLKEMYELLISYGIANGFETTLTRTWSSVDTATLVERGAREFKKTAKVSCSQVESIGHDLLKLMNRVKTR